VEGLCESASRSIRARLCTGPLREVLREKKKNVNGWGEGGRKEDGMGQRERKKENTSEASEPRCRSNDWRYQSTGALCSRIIWRAAERARSQIPRSDNGPYKTQKRVGPEGMYQTAAYTDSFVSEPLKRHSTIVF